MPSHSNAVSFVVRRDVSVTEGAEGAGVPANRGLASLKPATYR
jgi:hypothetical protein